MRIAPIAVPMVLTAPVLARCLCLLRFRLHKASCLVPKSVAESTSQVWQLISQASVMRSQFHCFPCLDSTAWRYGSPWIGSITWLPLTIGRNCKRLATDSAATMRGGLHRWHPGRRLRPAAEAGGAQGHRRCHNGERCCCVFQVRHGQPLGRSILHLQDVCSERSQR